MLNKLIYLTTNPHKVQEANEFLVKKYGFNLEIMKPSFEVLEIQAKTCGEVAKFSAKYAAEKLGVPVLKSDSGLYIEALGGLPGPYNAYFDKQIGTEKFLDMMKDIPNGMLNWNIVLLIVNQDKNPSCLQGEVQGAFLMKPKERKDVGMTSFIFLMGKKRHSANYVPSTMNMRHNFGDML